MNLPPCYKLIIAPVADLLDGCKIIIVPDHYLYNIQFAVLPDEGGKTLSETFKICVASSFFNNSQLIHDRPADFHNQTSALSDGGESVNQGSDFQWTSYVQFETTFAEEKAEMVGSKLLSRGYFKR